jgi:cold shock CspA family protein
MRGFISRITKAEGSGFIQGDDNPDVYFDISDVSGETLLSLSLGECVEYDL